MGLWGGRSCWQISRASSPPSRWPTRWRASPGLCWRTARPTARGRRSWHENTVPDKVPAGAPGNGGSARVNTRDGKVGQPTDRMKPAIRHGASRPRAYDWSSINGSHQGPRHRPRQKAGHMTAGDPIETRAKIALVRRGPSTHDEMARLRHDHLVNARRRAAVERLLLRG